MPCAQIWREHQPHHSLYTAAMEAAGLQVEVAAHDYTAQLPLATWLGMMRSRFWSTFSHCSDEELEQVGRVGGSVGGWLEQVGWAEHCYNVELEQVGWVGGVAVSAGLLGCWL